MNTASPTSVRRNTAKSIQQPSSEGQTGRSRIPPPIPATTRKLVLRSGTEAASVAPSRPACMHEKAASIYSCLSPEAEDRATRSIRPEQITKVVGMARQSSQGRAGFPIYGQVVDSAVSRSLLAAGKWPRCSKTSPTRKLALVKN